ncbi:MAG: pyridoxal-dependent decarboxylase, exosortase A system-associated [Gammaproteobacteria bacterium]|nr:pyridoxal-dependent decarboxylase, exosortase A system-associated [Gammaproteobacteria bacterium]
MTRTSPQHAPMTQYRTEDNCLVIGDMPLDILAHRIGQTPFYAYDRNLISQRISTLRNKLPDQLHIHYAMKANPMPAVVQHLAGIVDGFDLASHQEMLVALDTTMSTDQISMAGPGKRPQELAAAIAAGITVNAESFNEIEQLAIQSDRVGLPANVAVRINPAFELKSSGMKMGGGPKQFGIDEESVPDALRTIKQLGLNFIGFHIYSGSQNLNAASIAETQSQAVDLAIRLQVDCPEPITKLNIGGGFGIPYFPGEKPLDLDQVGESMATLCERVSAELGKTNLIIELGRYIVGEAGIYVCKIVDRKLSRGQVFLVTDGGLNHHLAASGNFGQIIRKNYPVTIGNKISADQLETASVVGPLCTPLDLLADKMQLPVADIGDLVVVFQSGAYGLTASPGLFLSQPEAVEVLV